MIKDMGKSARDVTHYINFVARTLGGTQTRALSFGGIEVSDGNSVIAMTAAGGRSITSGASPVGAGELVAARRVDADGGFIFDGIKYGTYTLCVVNSNGTVVAQKDLNIDRMFQTIKTSVASSGGFRVE